MAQRGAGARFMGGAWVFPGGVVDESDGGALARAALDAAGSEDVPWRAAALRELVEETGVWLADAPFCVPVGRRPHGHEVYAAAAESLDHRFAASTLRYFSNWVTPTVVPVRFDARFYVAAVGHGIDGEADGREMDAVDWVHPPVALAAARRGDFVLPLPTRHILRQFADLGSPGAILDFAERQEGVPAIQPRLSTAEDGSLKAVLPGEPGYDELTDDPPDPDALQRSARVTTLEGDSIPELQRRAD